MEQAHQNIVQCLPDLKEKSQLSILEVIERLLLYQEQQKHQSTQQMSTEHKSQ